MSTNHPLEVNGICFSYRKEKEILHNISFSLKQGEILTILGSNGAGKSTLLNCITGMLRPNSGEVSLDGHLMKTLGLTQAAKLLSYVPQMHDTAFEFLVEDYLVMGRNPYMRWSKSPNETDYAWVDEQMERLGIGWMAEKKYNQLSGGEKQQVQICRAIIQGTPVIIFDEPTNHLDFGNQQKILCLISDLAAEGKAIILTTHNPDHAILLGGTVAVLQKSGAFTIGSVSEMITKETMETIYDIDLQVFHADAIGRKMCACSNLRERKKNGV